MNTAQTIIRTILAVTVLIAVLSTTFGNTPIDKAILIVAMDIFVLLYVQHDAK